MTFEGARDHDSGPGVLADALCLFLALLNAALWPALVWLIVAP